MDLGKLRKHQLEDLRKHVLDEMKRRYVRNRVTKYGDIPRAFSDQELARFWKELNNPVVKAVLALQAGLGLRIGEAVSVRSENVDLCARRLWVPGKKGAVPTMLFLHDDVLAALQEYEAVRVVGEFYFPRLRGGNQNTPGRVVPGHVDPGYVRKVFGIARERAGLSFSYGVSDERYAKRPRRLYRLTAHSLRHYFGRKVYTTTGDIYLAKKLLRHVHIKNTEIYVRCGQEDLDSALVSVFAEKL